MLFGLAFSDSAHQICSQMPSRILMDATRVADGLVVCMKRVKRNGKERNITQHLSEEALRADPRNHCVPLLDILDPEDDDEVILVEPLLRKWNDPEFESMEDAVVFVEQMLEVNSLFFHFSNNPNLKCTQGLVFMHEKNVAHRYALPIFVLAASAPCVKMKFSYQPCSDCARDNIMMDAPGLFPRGFHPQSRYLTSDATRPAKPRSRTAVPQPRYYFIDFGISTWVQSEEDRLVEGRSGQDKTAPELGGMAKYDPFKLDVYILGNLFKTELLSVCHLTSLFPLARMYTQLS